MSDRSYAITRTLSSVFLVGCLLLFVIRTWHWPLMGDAALMHYVVFLMDHGMASYRDIVDPNMPTTLLIEGAVMHLFGGNSLAWRLFDLALLAVSAIAMFVICKPYSRFAALFAAALFALIHGRDGLVQLGQRDLTMTVCLLIAYAFLFTDLRTHHRALLPIKTKPWTALFGFFCGVATTIKPSVLLLAPTVLLLAAITLRRRRQPFASHIIAGLIGMLTPILLIFGWLQHQHITADFLRTLTQLLPYFLLLGPRSYTHLILHSISSVMLPVVLLWLPIVILKKDWITWERAALLVAVLFGLASFYLQRKGFPYHRYPSEAFLLLLIGIDFTTILKTKPANRRLRFTTNNKLLPGLAMAGIVVSVLFIGVGSTAHALWQDWHNQEFDTLLRADLNRLGGQDLANRVQCLDMADGCIPTLYNMRLVQATGYLYDCYMLSDQPGAERDRSREAFWKAIMKNPPAVFVISSNDCDPATQSPGYTYQKVSRWPQFHDYLKATYHLDAERIPPHMVKAGSSPSKPLGYRIYVRNNLN
ncbi:glycosyltransferase family 39 protein [Tunturiibacter gelidiferens]|uniref:Glycosyltransferase family 39 protein n=1 Tax=Tunturiibacter gelidiferens TaxID=3069689 RepID=A0AAU7Z2U6_9BACT